MSSIKKYIKDIVPTGVWNGLHNCRAYVSLRQERKGLQNVEREVRAKEDPLKVLFFLIWDNNWKCDSLFKKMLEMPEFNPLIVICPIVNNGREYMIENLKKVTDYFQRKGYPCVCAYNEKTDTYVDVHQFQPDIIFYTNPYKGLVDDRYYINQYSNVLSCYVNYFYVTNSEPWACAENFHMSLWKYYLEYPLLMEQIKKLVRPISIRGKVVGYPLFDTFRQYEISDKDWPVIRSCRKRIIWAPHHTISGNTEIYAMSTFEKYYDYMWQMAEKYKNEIDIVFKPHPLLKPHLYEAEEWGKERTDAYYEKWATGANTAFVDGEYVGLFLASNAMIHDCNSFTVEYLAANKPAMFLDSGMTDDKINEAGKEARACYYKGYCEADIENFIKMIIEGGTDELKEKREAFYKNYILPPNGKLAAENIIDDLLTSLGRK